MSDQTPSHLPQERKIIEPEVTKVIGEYQTSYHRVEPDEAPQDKEEQPSCHSPRP